MYDKVKVYFDDGTDTIIFVSEDDDIQNALAELADETGLGVKNYSILGVEATSVGVYYDPDA